MTIKTTTKTKTAGIQIAVLKEAFGTCVVIRKDGKQVHGIVVNYDTAKEVLRTLNRWLKPFGQKITNLSFITRLPCKPVVCTGFFK